MKTPTTPPPSSLAGASCYASLCGRVTLYLGDCGEIAATLQGVDAVVSDPPYPDCFVEEYEYRQDVIEKAIRFPVRQFIFWSGVADFPWDATAIHIWNKNPSNHGAQYERIFERNGNKQRKVWTRYMVNSTVAAQMTGDVRYDHPSQKPIHLMGDIVNELPKECTVLDPFMGSGTTGVACIRTGRRFIGIEKNPTHYAAALDRITNELAQGDLFLGHNV